MNNKKLTIQKKDFIGIFGISTFIIIMASGLITGHTKWSLFDFLLAGILLVGTGFLLMTASRGVKNTNRRKLVIFAITITLIVIWAELAVGLFGSPFAGS